MNSIQHCCRLAILGFLSVAICFGSDVRIGQRVDGPLCKIADDRIVVGINQGVFVCIDQKGAPQWQYTNLSGRIATGKMQALFSAKNDCVFAFANGIAALNLSGTEIWRITEPKPRGARGALSPDESVLYTVEEKFFVHAYSAKTGEQLWRSEKAIDQLIPLSVDANSVAGVDTLGRVLCFSNEGRYLWTMELDSRAVGLSAPDHLGKRLVVCDSGVIVDINGEGKVEWKRESDLRRMTGFTQVDQNHFAFFSQGAVAMVTRDGRLIWTYENGSGLEKIEHAGDRRLVLVSEELEWKLLDDAGRVQLREQLVRGSISTNIIKMQNNLIVFGTDTGWLCWRKLK